jgi:hypothetical protein
VEEVSVSFGGIKAVNQVSLDLERGCFLADDRLAALANQLDGAYAMSPNFGSALFPSRTFEQMKADLKAVGSTASANGSGTLTAYGSADLFLSAFAKIQVPVTTEALAKVLNSGFEYQQLGNAVCGSNWPEFRVEPSDCASILRFNGRKKTLEPLKDLGVFGKQFLFAASKS